MGGGTERDAAFFQIWYGSGGRDGSDEVSPHFSARKAARPMGFASQTEHARLIPFFLPQKTTPVGKIHRNHGERGTLLLQPPRVL